MKTQVGIIGGGPSGLLLARLLSLAGIKSVILEKHTQEYVEGRIRAGILEEGMVKLLQKAQVAERMNAEGLIHKGIEISFLNRLLRIDLESLTDGKTVMVYGQTELTKDLYHAVLNDSNIVVVFQAEDVMPEDFLQSSKPKISFKCHGTQETLFCDFIAGCDGFHGIARKSIPRSMISEYEKVYPFGWLGLLADVPPVNDELVYIYNPRGFALCSMRSRTRSRYYLQVSLAEHVDDWPDERFWDELRKRLPESFADKLITGPSIEKSIAPLRSFVAEPLSFGHLFLVGDAGHIVPPTGAKGLNLAASDVYYLSTAFVAWYQHNQDNLLKQYSEVALKRIWAAERFSWWMTNLLHHFGGDGFDHRMQQAEFDYLTKSKAAQTVLAENYVGLPF